MPATEIHINEPFADLVELMTWLEERPSYNYVLVKAGSVHRLEVSIFTDSLGSFTLLVSDLAGECQQYETRREQAATARRAVEEEEARFKREVLAADAAWRAEQGGTDRY